MDVPTLLFTGGVSIGVAYLTAHIKSRFEIRAWRGDLAARYAEIANVDRDHAHRLTAQFAIGFLYHEREGGEVKQKVFIPEGCRLLIGRAAECDLLVQDGFASRQHALIASNGKKVIVIDLNSTNGTFVNGKNIGPKQTLKDGDILELGDSKIHFLRV